MLSESEEKASKRAANVKTIENTSRAFVLWQFLNRFVSSVVKKKYWKGIIYKDIDMKR